MLSSDPKLNFRDEPRAISKLLDKLLKAESKLLNSNDHIKSIPYNGLSETIFERTYANSDGAFRYQKGSQSSIYLYARAEQTGRKPSNHRRDL